MMAEPGNEVFRTGGIEGFKHQNEDLEEDTLMDR